jgi:hypothetical protein
MQVPFIKFSFYEDNLKAETDRLKTIIRSLAKEKAKYSTLAEFPPCIIKKAIPKAISPLVLSGSNIVLSSNILYGEQYKDINMEFRRSPFISASCKECQKFKESICRGILNQKFLAEKEKIVKRIGLDNYNAVKSDYETGLFVFGSVCNNTCKFCIDKFAPASVVRKIPFLSKSEILHFLHSIPGRIKWIGSSYHCASGEFFDHPEFYQLLDMLPSFMSKNSWIFTNCISLDENQLKAIKKKDLKLILSIHTLNDEIRQNIMCYKAKFRIKDKLKMIDEYGICYQCCFLAMDSLIKSKDTEESFKYLVNHTNTCLISFSASSSTNYIKEEMRKELDVDRNETDRLLEYNHDLNPNYKAIQQNEFEANKSILSVERAMKLMPKKKILILSPKGSVAMLNSRFKDNHSVQIQKVDSFLGEEVTVSGVLTVNDYISAISKANFNYDCILIPRNSFDINLDDFTLCSINIISSKFGKAIILS